MTKSRENIKFSWGCIEILETYDLDFVKDQEGNIIIKASNEETRNKLKQLYEMLN
tara:strand:+ start:194 stop:358 length:165 start_codon:yes stop_codon:yes gene_type:complete